VRLHTLAAWALLLLWAFTIFWQFTTGEWRQYLPTLKKVDAMARYYAWGMFRGAPHPYQKTVQRKHNPLQRLAYLALLAMVSPLIWGSGLLYLFRAFWPQFGRRPLADPGVGGLGPHGRRLHDADLLHRARLPDHHRPHAAPRTSSR
jgi:thiosulfate reductase cytochrome b subunit